MSFTVSLSGLNAASNSLEVISNNLANSGTTGYKASSAQYSEVFASVLGSTSSNAIGQGVQLQSVTQEFTQGNIEYTENPFDLAINGDGFFQLDSNGSTVFSRAGNFNLDADGYMVNPGGDELIVALPDSNGNITSQTGILQVDFSNQAPSQTAEMVIDINLDSSATEPDEDWLGDYDAYATPATTPDTDTYNYNSTISIYDSLGNEHTASTYFLKTENANEWESYVLIDGVEVSGPTTYSFDENGEFDEASLPVEITVTNWTPLNTQGSANGAAVQSFTIDLSDASQFGSYYSASSLSQDGYGTGQLSSVDIDEDGVIFAQYTNGRSTVLGQVVLANFNNPQGLDSIGNNLWVQTYSSGQAVLNTAGSTGTGSIVSGALEQSNVDTADQLIKMIEAQQRYQANAQAIETENSLVQTIMNIF